jgi:putative ABC transport system permease protein
MKTLDIIARASRSIRQAKARTLLTSLAIGVGAFTITLALAAGAGGRQYAQDIISANTNTRELRVTQKQNFDASKPQKYTGENTQVFGNGFAYKQLSQHDLDQIAKLPQVDSVAPIYSLNVQYVTRTGQDKYQAQVIAFDSNITQDYLAGGAATVPTSAVISEGYRQVLGFSSNQAAIGQPVELVVKQAGVASAQPVMKTFAVTVSGVYKSSSLSFTNSSSIQVPGELAKEIYTYNQQGTPSYGLFMGAYVFAHSSDVIDQVKQSISAKGFEVQTAKDLMSTIFQFINVLQGILLGFGVLAVLTSVFGIINTQYISVLERTQQIGLMKALGMRRRDVGRLFKFEAAWIGFLGGAIGAGIAILAGSLANPWITNVLSLGKGTNLLIFEPQSVAAIIVGLMLVSVGAGILPARKAAKLDPIEALRTE